MRVSYQSLFQQVNDGVQRSLIRLSDAQRAAATGKRLNEFADDPFAMTQVFGLRSAISSLRQYDRNIANGLPVLEITDTVFGQVTDVLGRARELAVAMANDTNAGANRLSAAGEVAQLFQQALSLANSQVEGQRLFGGFQNGADPFDASGAYLGDSGDIAIQTTETSTLSLNFPGNEVFQGVGVLDGVGIFDVLRDLESVLRGNTGERGLSLKLNLDSAAATPGAAFPTDGGPTDNNPAVGVIDATLANFQAASNYSTNVKVFDSLGDAHTLTFFFRNDGGNAWSYQVATNAADLGGSAADLRQVGTGSLNFDGAGALTSSTANPISLTGLVNNAATVTIPSGTGGSLTFSGTTQLAASSKLLTRSQTNTDGFAPQIARFDATMAQINSFRTEVGARLNTAEAIQERLARIELQTVSRRAEIEEIDIVEAFSDLARLEQAFTAALQVSARLTQLSLLNFLQ